MIRLYIAGDALPIPRTNQAERVQQNENYTNSK